MVLNENYIRIEVFGIIKSMDAPERIRAYIETMLFNITDEISFDYARFIDYAATLFWEFNIIDFMFIDDILKKLKKAMDINLLEWEVKINFNYIEKGV